MFLRMVARPLMAKVKQTTGIKKVPKDVVLREVLIGLHSQILNEIEKLPEYLTDRKYLMKFTKFNLKTCMEEEDVEYLPRRLFAHRCKVEDLVEEARRELSIISGMVADWNPYHIRPPSFSSQETEFYGYGNLNEREQLIHLYFKALSAVEKVPKNNKLRMFAESSIIRKLKVCQEDDDWQSIKSKLGYEDPVQKAREELYHWSLFFGPEAYPNRQYPAVPRTKEFCERFDAWCELASSENHASSENFKISSTYQSGKDTPTVVCSI